MATGTLSDATEGTPLMNCTVHQQPSLLDSSKTRIRRVLERAKTRFHRPASGTGESCLSEVLKDVEEEEKQNRRYLLFAVLSLINHIVGGAFTLHFIEGWSLYDAAYFCIVTTTTVGYGDITPSKTLAKLFVIYYVIVSIGLISALLAYIVGLLLDRQEELLMKAIVRDEDDEVGNLHSQPQDEEQAISVFPFSLFARGSRYLDWSDYVGLAYSSVVLLLILGIGIIVFMHFEQLTFLDALYTTVISATTVGFGDFEPTREVSKSIMTVWLVFSTICVAKVVADFTDASNKAKQRAVTRRLLTASVTREALDELDTNQDGSVDKVEFLSQMLIRSGKVEMEVIRNILKRFDELDVNDSGSLDQRDLRFVQD